MTLLVIETIMLGKLAPGTHDMKSGNVHRFNRVFMTMVPMCTFFDFDGFIK